MSGRTVISVRDVGKRYRLGESVSTKGTLRDSLASGAQRLFRRSNEGKRSASDFWALKDVSFDVAEGEVLGIIGANGAGKSTLLKILSQITDPTQGEIRIRGRMASLLEVGTGFHPELTGRENVFMNGAVLGMSQAEIRRKFDEIVEFAGVEPFIDTPVKRYSSGMQVRLGFSVAAHLDPKILLVDEVLAVGDARFQQKCLMKIDGVARNGRTVIFVSHNLAAMRVLCSAGSLLVNGVLALKSEIDEVITEYLRMTNSTEGEALESRGVRGGRGRIRIRRVVSGLPDGLTGPVRSGGPAALTFELNTYRPGLSCGFTFYDQHGQAIAHFDSSSHGPADRGDIIGGHEIQWITDVLPLVPGRYRINVALSLDGVLEDLVEGAVTIQVAAGDIDGRIVPLNSRFGSVFFSHRWRTPATAPCHQT